MVAGGFGQSRRRDPPSWREQRAPVKMQVLRTHLVPQSGTATAQLEERTSAVSGLPAIAFKEPAGGRHLGYKRDKGMRIREQRTNREVAQLEALQEAARAETEARGKVAWRVHIGRKWRCGFHVLDEVKSQPTHRLAPLLERRILASERISRATLERAFLDNFALDREERQRCAAAIAECFTALDEDFRGLVHWPEFLCHLRVLEVPRQSLRERLRAMFRLVANQDTKVDLAGVWRIVRTFALNHERALVAEALLPSLPHIAPHLPVGWSGSKAGQELDALVSAESAEGPETRGQSLGLDAFERHVTDNRELHALLQRLCWARLAEAVRLSVSFAKQSENAARFEAIDVKIRWLEAREWWRRRVVPDLLRARFDRWRAFAVRRIHVRRGTEHFADVQLRRALDMLGLHAEGRAFHRWRERSARRFARRVTKASALRRWKAFLRVERKVVLIQVQKARRLYESFLLESRLHTWRAHARCLARHAALCAAVRRRFESSFFRAWAGFAVAEALRRVDDDYRSEVRHKVLQHELEEERAAEQELQRLALEAAALATAEEERLEQEAREYERKWEDQRHNAHSKLERRAVMRRQTLRRDEHKGSQEEAQREELRETFDELLAQSVKAAETEAGAFMRTAAGKQQIALAAEKIQSEADALLDKEKDPSADDNQEGSDWQRLVDPDTESYFMYNRTTGEKVPITGMGIEEALKVAEANYVAAMAKVAHDDVEALREQEVRQRQVIWATRKVQAAWRVRKGRDLVHAMIATVYLKRKDAYTGQVFYYNTTSRKSNWSRPLNLGRRDIKLSEWTLRCDDEAATQWTFENNVSPWLTNKSKPSGYLTCLVCKLQLTTVSCETCCTHFCLDCFEQAHPLKSEELRAHDFRRKPHEKLRKDAPESCIVCKTNNAERFCLECGLEGFYCEGCYTMSHTKNPRRPTMVTAKQKHVPALEI